MRTPPRVVAKQRIMPLSYTRAFVEGTGEDEASFRAAVQQRLAPNTSVIPVGRARSGIYLLTKLALQSGRHKVLLSPFTIPDVVNMVMLAGAEPVFFDFDSGSTSCSLDSLRALIDRDTAAVLITHYHVNEPRLEAIAAICRLRGAYLFDDCAISFGGSMGNQRIGTLTDASVFSMSSFKLLNFFWGGMVTTRDQHLANALESIVSAWPRLGPREYAAPARRCLQYDLASRPLAFASLVFPLFRARLKLRDTARGLEGTRLEATNLDSTLASRPSLAAFAEWNRKIGKISRWLARRRFIAGVYRKRLGNVMVSANTPEAILEGSCFVNFPVVVPAERCNRIHRAMMLAGYDVGRSLYPNVHRHPKFTQVAGQSANVDRLVAGTIYLPTHFGVSEAYAEAIADRLAEEIR